jgi:transcriptional regulator with XRE-family HTH domain
MGSTGPQKLVTVVWSGLAAEVRHIRDQCGLSLEAVCNQLGWQQSKLSRMERGQQCISAADLASLLVIYKVTGQERTRLLHLVERQDEPGRWILDSPLGQTPLARLEAEATSLVTAHPLLVPGLAHTTDYACAVMKSDDVPAQYVEPRVAARLERQVIFTKDRLPKFDMIVDEIALRRVVGSRKVTARQLRALLDFADRPNVRLWVVPFERGADAGFHSPFHTIGFPRGESVVQLESKESAVYIEDKEKIEIFHRHAAKLGKAALDPARSADLVVTIAKEHERG